MNINRKPWKERFKDKVAIVTGGSSGIGQAFAEELCKEGASVAFTGISEIGLNTEKKLKEQGFDALFLLAVDGGYLAIGPEGLGETTVNAGSE